METKDFSPLKLKEIVEILIKHYDIHDGLYDIAFELQLGLGNFGPSPEASLPGAALGIGAVKLVKSTKTGPHTVDASVANPANKRTTPKSKHS